MEVEIGATFDNFQTAAAMQKNLRKLGHQKLPATTSTENSPDKWIFNDKKAHEIFTCIFIGYMIDPNRTSFTYFGKRVPNIWPIMSQNTIYPTPLYDEGNFLPLPSFFKWNDTKNTAPITCENVLKQARSRITKVTRNPKSNQGIPYSKGTHNLKLHKPVPRLSESYYK